MAVFEYAIDYVLQTEKGFVHNPLDHGGATNFGITQQTLASWRRCPVSVSDVQNMDVMEAEAIYKAQYWDTLNLNQVLHQGVAVAIFSVGVNMGIITVAKYVQFICRSSVNTSIVIDGMLGPKTMSFLNQMSPSAFLQDFSQIVKDRYQQIVTRDPSQKIFLEGWLNRSDKLLDLVLIKD